MTSDKLRILTAKLIELLGSKSMRMGEGNETEITIHGKNQKDEDIELVSLYVEEFNTVQITQKAGWKFQHICQTVPQIEKWIESGYTHEQFRAPIATLKELHDNIKADKVTVDVKGHFNETPNSADYYIKRIKENIIDEYERTVKLCDPKEWDSLDDGKKTKEEVAERRIEMGKYMEKKLAMGFSTAYPSIRDSSDYTCPTCGNRHNIMIVDAHNITLAPSYSDREKGNIDATCVFAKGLKPKVANITLTSGQLVFGNYFRVKDQERHADTIFDPQEKDNGKPYDYYGLCSQLGRENLMHRLAEDNIGYGQMGNMSVSIFINPTKDKIIIGDGYQTYEEDDTLNPDYVKAKEGGFVMVGEISLSVWRYMFADLDVLKAANADIDMEGSDFTHILSDLSNASDNYSGYIMIDVPAGDWVLTHYYDNTPDPEDGRLFVYATFDLVK